MSEPLRKPDAVYDAEPSEKPVTRPDLKALEGGGESTPGRASLSAVKDAPDPGAIKDQEEAGAPAGGNDKSDSLYKPGDRSRISKMLGFSLSSSASKKALIGGGIGAALVGVAISLFFALLPLKINHLVENLQDRFFASTASATDKWSEKLFAGYIRKHILPNLGTNCKGTVDKNCVGSTVIEGSSPAARLYQGWKDARIETRLAENYGLEFIRENNTYTMRIRGDTVASGDIDAIDRELSGGRSDVRRAYRSALKDESRFKQALYRFRVGNLLERKYGIKRCIIACEKRDDFADWKDRKGTAFKVKLVERVVTPRNEIMAVVFECVFTGGCQSSDTDIGPDGERRDFFQREVQQKLDALAVKYGTETVEAIIKNADTILQKGFTRYLVEKVVTDVAGDSVGKGAGKAVPIIGWVDAAAQIVRTIDGANSGLKKWAYITQATAAVSLYMMYVSHNDELKEGQVDAEFVGSFTSGLSQIAGDKNQSAEASPLYTEWFGTGSDAGSPTAGLFTSVSALDDEPSTYTCDNGEPPAAGKKICPEEDMNTNNIATGFLAAVTGNGVWDALNVAEDFWNSTVGKIAGKLADAASFILENIPGYDAAVGAIGSVLEPLQEALAEALIPSPISENMSGARAFQVMAAGADVAGNDFAHYGLGAKAITDVEAAAIRNDVDSEARAQFASRSLGERLFSKDTPYSMVSRLAMAMPLNSATSVQNVASGFFKNPFSKLSGSFSSLLGSRRAYAATEADPFSIKQYGIPLDDPVYNIDPEILTDEYCTEFNAAWSLDVSIDDNNGMDVHNRVNPCKLNESTTVGLGALYTDDVL